MIFTPQTDLAILNYIANYIIQTDRVNKDFVNKHTNFRLGETDIGYGLRPEHPLEQKAKNNGKTKGSSTEIDFKEYAKFVSTYTAEYTSKLSGVSEHKLKELAEMYADPKIKVTSFWTMGFNQHTRGVWANNLVYNIHLLTGKISTPGNSPFSLTGQPSACGTAREVGTFSHRLPADMVVKNPKHRAIAEKIWQLPEKIIIPIRHFNQAQSNQSNKDVKVLNLASRLALLDSHSDLFEYDEVIDQSLCESLKLSKEDIEQVVEIASNDAEGILTVMNPKLFSRQN